MHQKEQILVQLQNQNEKQRPQQIPPTLQLKCQIWKRCPPAHPLTQIKMFFTFWVEVDFIFKLFNRLLKINVFFSFLLCYLEGFNSRRPPQPHLTCVSAQMTYWRWLSATTTPNFSSIFVKLATLEQFVVLWWPPWIGSVVNKCFFLFCLTFVIWRWIDSILIQTIIWI